MLHRKNKSSKHVKEKQKNSGKAKKDRMSPSTAKRRNWIIGIAAVVVIAITVGVVAGLNSNNSLSQINKNGASPSTSTGAPPAIYNIQVSRITSYSMKIAWETDRACTGQVMYTQENTNNTFASWPEEKNTTAHSIELIGLNPATTYHLQIKCTDEKGIFNIYKLAQTYTTAEAISALGLKVGDEVKDFELISTSGEKFRLSEIKDRSVMLVFWQHSCKACREEMPFLREFYNNRSHEIALLAINDGEDEPTITAFAKSEKLTFPVLLDPERKVTESYTIATFPTILLVNNMQVTKIKEGSFKSVDEIVEFAKPAP